MSRTWRKKISAWATEVTGKYKKKFSERGNERCKDFHNRRERSEYQQRIYDARREIWILGARL